MSTPTDPGGLWWIVAEREIRTKLRERAFLVSTLITTLAVVLGIVVGGYFADRPSTRTVAVVDVTGAAAVESAAAVLAETSPDDSLKTVRVADDAEAEQTLRDDEADAALLPGSGGYQVVGETEVDTRLGELLRAATAEVTLAANAEEQRVDLATLRSGSEVTERLLDERPENYAERQVASFVYLVLFLGSAIGSGMMLAQSVTQEKESRVVEILAAAMPIRSLLWGKVLGHTLLAMLSVTVVLTAAVLALLLTGRSDLLGAIAPSLLSFLPMFFLGFLALATLWALAGSLASRQQDLGSTTVPMQMLVFIPYVGYFVGSERVQEVMSLLPLFSMMLMPARIAGGGVPWWQLGVAVSGTLLLAGALVGVARSAYERTVLRTATKIGFREALTSEERRSPR